jgi:hypothetical protein
MTDDACARLDVDEGERCCRDQARRRLDRVFQRNVCRTDAHGSNSISHGGLVGIGVMGNEIG